MKSKLKQTKYLVDGEEVTVTHGVKPIFDTAPGKLMPIQ